MDEAGNYGFGTWRPESSEEEETSGGAATFHATGSRDPGGRPERPRETEGEERWRRQGGQPRRRGGNGDDEAWRDARED